MASPRWTAIASARSRARAERLHTPPAPPISSAATRRASLDERAEWPRTSAAGASGVAPPASPPERATLRRRASGKASTAATTAEVRRPSSAPPRMRSLASRCVPAARPRCTTKLRDDRDATSAACDRALERARGWVAWGCSGGSDRPSALRSPGPSAHPAWAAPERTESPATGTAAKDRERRVRSVRTAGRGSCPTPMHHGCRSRQELCLAAPSTSTSARTSSAGSIGLATWRSKPASRTR